MKIDLLQESFSPWTSHRPRPVNIKRMVPFVMKATGRVHRVRSARIYFHRDCPEIYGGRTEHIGVHLWCGQQALPGGRSRALLLHEPPDGAALCGTCEGRAVGAGQQAAAWFTPPDRPLIFTPRTGT